jgi:hypothetical protein
MESKGSRFVQWSFSTDGSALGGRDLAQVACPDPG